MKIEFLFPEVANFYGEKVQMRLIKQCIPEAEVFETPLTAEPAFVKNDVSLIYIGPMTEHTQELCLERLMPHKERLNQLIDTGCVFLALGNAFELFGKYIENEDGSKVECLGIFDTYARRDMMHRYNSLYLGDFGDIKIVGYKAQFSHSYGDPGKNVLFKTVKGDGLHPGFEFEGIKRNNFFGTYILGPILIMNPYFAKYFFRLLTGEEITLPAEKAMIDAYNRRLSLYSQSDCGFSE